MSPTWLHNCLHLSAIYDQLFNASGESRPSCSNDDEAEDIQDDTNMVGDPRYHSQELRACAQSSTPLVRFVCRSDGVRQVCGGDDASRQVCVVIVLISASWPRG